MVQDFIFPIIARVVNFQEVALRTFGQSSTLYRCQFNGFQDTLYTNNGNQFYRESIERPIHHHHNTIENYEEWINRTRVGTLRNVTLDAGDNVTIKSRVKWALATNDPRIISTFTMRIFINGDKWNSSTVPHYFDLV
ncbi:hypothetical protein H5410_005443 [Solanum commersonii]|uniref:Pectinesterase catalytic domain-containing protein n=1 Tax=Solanum commersonii TaxID=4109 RepID=A0A9J6A6R7_SOLCO|nr:hypothetical protein H5410_005443 [Solanum commersonii]